MIDSNCLTFNDCIYLGWVAQTPAGTLVPVLLVHKIEMLHEWNTYILHTCQHH
jgi:hypothetical protein